MTDTEERPRLNGCLLHVSKCFTIPQRYVMAILAFFGVMNCYALRSCFSIAINQIVHIKDHNLANYTQCVGDVQEDKMRSVSYEWTHRQKTWSLCSFYFGYFLTQFPGGFLAEYFGGKQVFGLSVLLAGSMSMIDPSVIKYLEWKGLVTTRLLMGAAQGVTFPALSSLLSNWIPLNERSRLGTLTFAGIQLGLFLGNAASGWLIERTEKWETVFYFFGSIAIFWFLLWSTLCYSYPDRHPCIKDEEFYFLKRELASGKKKRPFKEVPLKGLFSNLPVWALVIASSGHDFTHYTLANYMPVYFREVLKVRIKKNGFYSSFPFLSRFVLAMICAAVGDCLVRKKKLSVTALRKILTGFNTYVPAIFLMLAAYNDCDVEYTMVMMCFCLGFMGCFYPGLRVNALDLSANYAGTITALCNTFNISAGVSGMLLTGYMTQQYTLGQWVTVFWISFGVRLVTGTFFLIWGSGEKQDFDRDDYVYPGCREGWRQFDKRAPAKGDVLKDEET